MDGVQLTSQKLCRERVQRKLIKDRKELCNSLLSFVPTTKEAYIIYGVGGTIDFIRSDQTAKQLPHKVVVDKYLEGLVSDDDSLPTRKKKSRDEEDD